jgi:predicted nuclease of restriction endonuclease-like (RecB) superfamily
VPEDGRIPNLHPLMPMKYQQLVKAIDSANQHLLGRAAAAVNQALVIRNWLIGAYIVEFEQRGEDRARYGERLMENLANDLRKRGLGGLSVPMLGRMRRLYQVYPQFAARIPSPLVTEFGTAPGRRQIGDSVTTGDRIGRTPSGQSPGVTPLSPEAVLHFSWTQLLELIRIDDPLKRAFYENECLKGNWSKRQLQRQIGSLLYERTSLSKNKKAVVARAHRQEPQSTIEDLIRDPYVLEFTGLAEGAEYHESDLEKALLNHLQNFLLELGAGFCFEARQKRVTVGNEHDYIDLVFYQRRLRCHVLLDLKTRPFKHADAGQMNYYVNYFKKRVMAPGDNPPVGIILCSDRDRTKVEFATAGMDNKLFVSRYLVNLPSAEQLSRFVEADRARIESASEQHAQGGAKPSRQGRPKKARRLNARSSCPASQTSPEGAVEP